MIAELERRLKHTAGRITAMNFRPKILYDRAAPQPLSQLPLRTPGSRTASCHSFGQLSGALSTGCIKFFCESKLATHFVRPLLP